MIKLPAEQYIKVSKEEFDGYIKDYYDQGLLYVDYVGGYPALQVFEFGKFGCVGAILIDPNYGSVTGYRLSKEYIEFRKTIISEVANGEQQ